MFLKLYCIFLKQCFIIQLIPNLRNPTSKTSFKVFQWRSFCLSCKLIAVFWKFVDSFLSSISFLANWNQFRFQTLQFSRAFSSINLEVRPTAPTFLLASRLGKNNFLSSSMETVLCWRESIFFTEYHDDWLCWSSSCFQKKEGILEGHFSHNSILTDQSPHGKPAVFEMMQTPTHLAMPWHILWWELITCDAEINYWKRGG